MFPYIQALAWWFSKSAAALTLSIAVHHERAGAQLLALSWIKNVSLSLSILTYV